MFVQLGFAFVDCRGLFLDRFVESLDRQARRGDLSHGLVDRGGRFADPPFDRVARPLAGIDPLLMALQRAFQIGRLAERVEMLALRPLAFAPHLFDTAAGGDACRFGSGRLLASGCEFRLAFGVAAADIAEFGDRRAGLAIAAVERGGDPRRSAAAYRQPLGHRHRGFRRARRSAATTRYARFRFSAA